MASTARTDLPRDSASRDAGPRAKAKRRKRSPLWWRIVKNAFLVGVGFALIGLIAAVGFFFKVRGDAAKIVIDMADLNLAAPVKPSAIYAADGTKLYQTLAERREPIALRDVPERVQLAVLAAEDTRFRTRSTAIDVEALGRAVVGKAQGVNKGGGSTLTMQLAKLKYSNSEQTYQRKIQDMAYAQAMDEQLTRDQILELYLNDVYFGEAATGIAAAAKTYFGKKVYELSYAESAMLARCVRRPSDQNPVRNYAKALENAHVVLGIMKKEGWITAEKYKFAMKARPKIVRSISRRAAPILKAGYYVSSVLLELKERGIDISSGGYNVFTTLDMGLQGRAEQEVRNIVARNKYRGVNTAAFVLVGRDGQILAEVGGTDFKRRKYNMVTMGGLQPGSAFKPIVYATAIEKGTLSEYADVSNAPIRIKDGRRTWSPRNSGGQKLPSYPLEVAFAQSINLPAIHTIQGVGPSNVVQFAKDKFGFRPEPGKPMGAYPSLALGTCQVTPLEMAQAYSVFMTGGTRVKPYAIERVVSPDGAVVFQGGPTRFEGVLKAETCAVIDRLLEAVVQRGTGKAALSIAGARGKTGTTNDAKDAWFCGYAQNLIGIGWIGNERNGRRYPMADGVFGGTVTVEMWREVMRDAVAKFGTRVGTTVVATTPEEDEARARRARRREARERAAREAEVPDPLIITDDQTTVDADTGQPVVEEPRATIDDEAERERAQERARERARERAEREAERAPVPADPPEPRRTEPSRRAPREEPAAIAQVEVCADSGGRATPYCPETITRPSTRRNRSRCPIHRGND